MDVSQFIELVRERPCLYDNKDTLSKNKKEKEKKWIEIATAMEITSDIAKNKWKNLKDNYIKHLKSTSADGGYCLKYLHWPWVSHMEFMKKHLTCISSTTIYDNDNPQYYETEHIIDSESSTRSDDSSEDMNNTERLQSNMAREDQLTTTPYIDKEQDDGYDATDLIFLGYAKTIKAFSIRRQAQIKLKLAKIIMEEELAHYEEISMYPQNPMYYSNPPSAQNDPLSSKLTQVKTEEF